MEGDAYEIIDNECDYEFQSTPSAWRETAKLHNNEASALHRKHNSDKIGLFIYPHKPKKEPFEHIFPQ